jgi:Beta-propeller repeat
MKLRTAQGVSTPRRTSSWISISLSIALCFSLYRVSHSIEVVPEAFISSVMGSRHGNEKGRAITIDPLGNVYVAGVSSSSDKLEFGEFLIPTVRDTDAADASEAANSDPDLEANVPRNEDVFTPGQDQETSTARDDLPSPNDIVLVKLNADGETAWIRRFGSDKNDKVTSIAYRHGFVYVAGSTDGNLDSKDTPDGTSDLFVIAFTENGDPAWSQPLQLGSGGNDSIEAIALDSSELHSPATSPSIYISGHVGGSIFRQAHQKTKEEANCSCRSDSTGRGLDITTLAEKLASNTSVSQKSFSLDLAAFAKESKKAEGEIEAFKENFDGSDMFIAKLSADGTVVDAVQIPLQFENSADAITVTGGQIYVAVNSYDKKPFDTQGSSALLVFCGEDMSYRTVYADTSYSHIGDFVQAMTLDAYGNAYLAGFTTTADRKEHSYFVRKFSGLQKQFLWETQVGISSGSMRPPKVSVAYGPLTDQVYVAGHGRGVFFDEYSGNNDANMTQAAASTADDVVPEALGRLHPRSGVFRTGLTVLSSQRGREILTWDKPVPFPIEYEDMQSITLDALENVVFTGKRLNKVNGLWDLCVGTFGSQEFSSSSRSGSPIQESGTTEVLRASKSNKESAGMGSLIVGLVVIAASITLMSIAAVLVITRTWMMRRFQIMNPSGGYLYDHRTVELSRFEQNAQQRFPASDADKYAVYSPAVMSARTLSSGSSSVVRRSVSSSTPAADDLRRGPGGSACPM